MHRALVGLGLLALLLIRPAASWGRAPNGERLSVYISTGDSLWLGEWLPVDSQAAVEELLDHSRNVLGADELIWRGGEDWMLHNHEIRRANADCYQLWNYADQVMRDGQLNRAVVRRAHQHGMKVAFLTELLGFGGVADIHPVPQPYEHKLRQEHPEWTAVNRYGTRRSNGPMEFAFPQVRRILIDDLATWTRRMGYDAVLYHTYVENFGLRYPDEFGFSPPIVEEYRKRYGVDIRTEKYDSDKLGEIRGEFVTQYLRELKAQLRKDNIKLKLCLDSQQPDVAMSWMAAGRIRMGGNIKMDWRRWVQEGIVDELVSFGGSYEAAENVLRQTQGSRTAVSMMSNWSIELPALVAQGMGNVRIVAEQQTLFGSTNYQPPLHLTWPLADTRSGFVEPPPATVNLAISPRQAASLDRTAKLALLRNVQFKAATAPLEVVAGLCKDPSILVRRQALLALAAVYPAEAVEHLVAALSDEEAGVRCMAVHELGRLKAAKAAQPLLRSLDQHPTFNQEVATRSALAAMPESALAEIAQGVKSPNAVVRAACLVALGERGSPLGAGAVAKALSDDDFYVRERAVVAFGRIGRENPAPLLNVIQNDPDADVQAWAAAALLDYLKRNAGIDAAQTDRAAELLQARFAEYGQGCKRADAEWGFRTFGDALVALLGEQGKTHLLQLMAQTQDPVLAARAWIVLFDAPTGEMSPEEDERLHKAMPPQVLQGLRTLVSVGQR